MPTLITSNRYNNIQQRISAIMGNPANVAPTTGYGQFLNTPDGVTGTGNLPDPQQADKISAQQLNNLYIDIARARIHQIGDSFSTQDTLVGNYEENQQNTDKIQESFFDNLESLMTFIETDKFLLDVSQSSQESLNINSSRTNEWSNSVNHTFTVSFASELERRKFFNSGGNIRISANIQYSGSESKTLDWQNILSSMGSVVFNYTDTFSSLGSGQSFGIGNYDLLSSYQLCYRKQASVYSNNNYEVYARNISNAQIEFNVIFNDGEPADAEFGIDETVKGTVNSIVEVERADGEALINGTLYTTVVVDAPVGQTTNNL